MAGGPRVADPIVFGKPKEKIGECSGRRAKCNSFASHWQVKGEDWQKFWRESQGWQIETVL